MSPTPPRYTPADFARAAEILRLAYPVPHQPEGVTFAHHYPLLIAEGTDHFDACALFDQAAGQARVLDRLRAALEASHNQTFALNMLALLLREEGVTP